MYLSNLTSSDGLISNKSIYCLWHNKHIDCVPFLSFKHPYSSFIEFGESAFATWQNFIGFGRSIEVMWIVLLCGTMYVVSIRALISLKFQSECYNLLLSIYLLKCWKWIYNKILFGWEKCQIRMGRVYHLRISWRVTQHGIWSTMLKNSHSKWNRVHTFINTHIYACVENYSVSNSKINGIGEKDQYGFQSKSKWR